MRLVGSSAAFVLLLALGTGTTANGSASACIAAPVFTSGSSPTSGGPKGVPWMRAGRTVGYLFGYGETLRQLSPGRVALFTGGNRAAGEAMKILWAVRDGRRVLTIRGDRLDGPGTFVDSFDTVGVAGAGSWGYHASIVGITAAGCWRLTALSPSTRGRFAVLAIDK
jgi:hypothetical protein